MVVHPPERRVAILEPGRAATTTQRAAPTASAPLSADPLVDSRSLRSCPLTGRGYRGQGRAGVAIFGVLAGGPAEAAARGSLVAKRR